MELSLHDIILMVTAPYSMIRTVNPFVVLLNGTCCALVRATTRPREVRVAAEPHTGYQSLVPSATFYSNKNKLPFTLERRQFSVAPAFAVTSKGRISNAWVLFYLAPLSHTTNLTCPDLILSFTATGTTPHGRTTVMCTSNIAYREGLHGPGQRLEQQAVRDSGGRGDESLDVDQSWKVRRGGREGRGASAGTRRRREGGTRMGTACTTGRGMDQPRARPDLLPQGGNAQGKREARAETPQHGHFRPRGRRRGSESPRTSALAGGQPIAR